MRLGVSLSLAGDDGTGGKSYVTGLGLAERTGFDSLWFFDTIGRGSFRPDPISAMSAAAAVTERIEIGPASSRSRYATQWNLHTVS